MRREAQKMQTVQAEVWKYCYLEELRPDTLTMCRETWGITFPWTGWTRNQHICKPFRVNETSPYIEYDVPGWYQYTFKNHDPGFKCFPRDLSPLHRVQLFGIPSRNLPRFSFKTKVWLRVLLRSIQGARDMELAAHGNPQEGYWEDLSLLRENSHSWLWSTIFHKIKHGVAVLLCLQGTSSVRRTVSKGKLKNIRSLILDDIGKTS